MENRVNDQREEVIIRWAEISDFDRVQRYLKDYWDDGNHIFARNTEYFKYFQVVDNKFNVCIGEGEKSKKIYGICAFVLCNKLERKDVQLNLLHVLKNKNSFSSIQLIDYIQEKLNCRIFSCCGIRPKTKIIYEYLGYYTGQLKHYYRLADNEKYEVAVVNNKMITNVTHGKYTLKLLPTFKELKKHFNIDAYKHLKPYKDEWCIEHRYYNSLHRNYKVYGVCKGKNHYDSIIVLREVSQNNTKICKIIDYIGLDEDIGELSTAIQRLIDENDYEYIDFYCIGISHDVMVKAGFQLRTAEDNNIIPQLFEPFEQSNKDIYFFTNDMDGFHMYRGDSDQDRANRVIS